MPGPRAYSKLLHELCVVHGHCGSEVHVSELLPSSGLISSRRFAELMLEAERMTPDAYGDQYYQALALIQTKFEQHMRCETVEAEALRH